MEPNDALRPRNWHYNYNNERELPLIQFCILSINPERPIPLAGWNGLVITKKMALQLNELEDKLTQIMQLDLPDGGTVADLYKMHLALQKPYAGDRLTHGDESD